ncbi:MAG: hypothetical protein KJ622_09530 [Alphaproteobacteria bacterium]|nr:hypothetical protein [Alphaproteobacteria bacterium]
MIYQVRIICRRYRFVLFANLLALCFAIAATVQIESALAAAPEGTKTIYLIDKSGNRHPIGNVAFAAAETTTTISVSLDETRFVEKFLSMRPFRCIDGPKQAVCHLPYPYELKNRVTGNDLSDLEYRLLFLHKGTAEYGINAWNGLYYKLEIAADGSLNGTLHEADFNVLAVPPDEPFTRPIGRADLVPAEDGRHRFPGLIIR